MAAEGSFAPTTKRWALFKALRREEGLDTPLEPIPKRRSTDPAPLSFAQQRLWFFDQLMPGNIVYNIPMALRILGPLNVTALQRSLGEIMNRHEALRTRFMSVEGRPIQVVSPAEAFTLPVIDLCHLADSERGVQEQRLAEEEAQRPFDLTRDPALRAKLLRLGEEHSVLLYSMHHIACDGWSMGVFTRELTELYDAFSRGRPPLLPELPIQYADFAVWQREWLTGEPLERQLEYWKRQLNGLAPLQLPEDRPRPAVLSFRGGRESLSLSPSLAKALRALSEREGVTLFMTLCAAFQTLLSRYTGQTDIAVGSPIANRNRTEIEGLIGFFVNTLVLRADLSGDPTFRELLGRVREVCLGAYTQQDLPFEKLVEELAPERTLSHTPLLQTMFVLQNVPKRAVELPGLQLTLSGVKTGTARFDLTAELIEEGEGLSCVFEYSTDLFDAPRIGRMLEHFHTLLKSIVTDPEERLSKFRLLIEPERRALLVEWNDTVAEYPNSACIHELFEAQVDRTPDAVAVVFEGRQLTYRELEARANQLARYLGKLGVGPDVLVGLCLERSLEMIVALLGVLKAGGAYVPLDPGYPEERLRFMLEDARAPVLLTQSGLCQRVSEAAPRAICLDTDWETVAREPETSPGVTITSDRLAYVIYTSGSTGRPKGVMIPHRAICNHMFWMQRAFSIDPLDAVLQKTPFSFDASVWEFYAPLLAGGRLVIVRPGGHQDAEYLSRVIDEQRITTLQVVPSQLRMLMAEPSFERCRSLRHVFCGGEVLPVELQNEFFERLPAATLHNLYGPTEAAIDSTMWTCAREPGALSVSIGRPIDNVEIYILDANRQPVPVGVAGELYIGGAGLARGYLNCPELTAERFVPHPFRQEPGARVYRTGDLACYRADGAIEFLGRCDHQVKIRGFRIELGEIEAVLSQYPAVRESVVLAREDSPGDKRLVAYVTPAGEPGPTSGELRAYVKEHLPEYMVPSAFVLLDALPLTPNGKVDRRALPAPDAGDLDFGSSYVAPRTPVEERLAKIWASVLGVECLGARDNFFELGGHSLLATQVVSRLQSAFQVVVPLRAIFENPTIEQLAVVVEQALIEEIERLNEGDGHG